MKLTTIILLAASLQVTARGFGQRVDIFEKNAPITKVFEDIKKQTGYTFAYTESILGNAKAVTMHIRNATLEEALMACFRDQPFGYSIIERTIVVQPLDSPLLKNLHAPDTIPTLSYIEIKGKVTDSLGKPLAGASVTVKGFRRGASTDQEGNFTVAVKDERSVLIVSIIGYGRKEITVGRLRPVIVVLSATSTDLNDVVVTGYQNKSRRLSAGSTSTINFQSVAVQPVASFDQMLQGQAPGLNIKTGSGQPGRSSDIVIRGKGSINGSTDPLYIVDGVQLEARDFAAINPADFETVTILKDGSSAGLYGSRGANGVIVVSTRKGREGQMIVTYIGQAGFSKLPPSKLKVMNSQQHVDFEMNLAGNPYGWTPAQADSLKKINFDWQNALYRTAFMQEHQLSVSGGNNKTKYFSSFSYLDQDGILMNTGLKRYTGRFNIEHTVNNFKFGTNIAGGWSKSLEVKEGNENNNPLNNFLWALPYEVPYTSTGQYTVSIQGVGNWTNPIEDLKRNLGHSIYTKAYGNGFLEYKFPMITGLSWRTNIGGDYSQNEYFTIVNNGTQSAQHDGVSTSPKYGAGSLSQGLNKKFRYTLTNSMSYKRLFGKEGKHNLSAGLYHETVRTQASGFGYLAFGLLNPFPNAAGLVAGTTTNGYIPVINNIIYTPDNGIVSFFGIVDYAYKNKLILGGSARRDGSSRLSKDNRWVNYGGISGAYILSEENFLHNNSTISLLKVKASYGTVGNQEGIGDFPYLQQYSPGTFGGGSSLGLSAFGNKNLKWETRSTFNTGVELGLFKNRIAINLEYYNSITNNLFFNLTTPSTSGGPGFVLGNAGSMRNRGFEASLDLSVIHNKDFGWNINANYSVNRNTVLSLPQGQQFQLYKKYQVLQVGKPFNSYYLVRFASVDPQTGSSVYLKKDGKTTTQTYDPNDRVALGTSDAPFNGGINNNFRFKEFSLSFNWVYSYGNSIFNYALVDLEVPGYSSAGFSANGINAWSKPGQITNFPSMNDKFETKTTRYLENDNFWRLRNVQLSYNLPKEYCRRLKINALRIFAQGQNLVTIFKVRAFDPEISTINSSTPNSNADITGAQYPPLRSYTFGASISF